MNKKYIPSALILYLNYFIHGVGCSILGQAVIKEALAASWGVEVMAITAISAALGLGRLIALPFAGPLSDKLGHRISTAIGSGSYAIYLIGLALAFNAGTNGGYQIAYICAIVGGIANSFLDTGIYPAVSEIIYKAPGVATMGIKFCIADAFTVRTWCNCRYNSNRSNLLQHTVLCMWNRLSCTSGTGYDLPTPGYRSESSGKERRPDRQLKAYPFLCRIHRNDPDRIHMYRYLPVMVELCTELCKRECWLG